MFSNALIFLVSTVCGLFIVALLLRFYMQWARAPYRNPLTQFLQALTDFMVKPARRVIPGLWGLDLATLVLAWLVQFLELLIVLPIQGRGLGPDAGVALGAMALLALVLLVRTALYVVMIVVFIQALLPWITPHSPVMPLLNSMTRPFLAPFQRRIRPIGNVDMSPMFVLVIIVLLLMLLEEAAKKL